MAILQELQTQFDNILKQLGQNRLNYQMQEARLLGQIAQLQKQAATLQTPETTVGQVEEAVVEVK